MQSSPYYDLIVLAASADGIQAIGDILEGRFSANGEPDPKAPASA